jgi:hypothetical protein
LLEYKGERERERERERAKPGAIRKRKPFWAKILRKKTEKKKKQKQYCVLVSASRPQDCVETGGWVGPGILGLIWSREDGN